MLHAVGKGRRERDVVVHDDVKALINRHQADIARAGIGSDPRAPVRTLLPSALDTLVTTPSVADPGARLATPSLSRTVGAQAQLIAGTGLDQAGAGDQLGHQHGSDG